MLSLFRFGRDIIGRLLTQLASLVRRFPRFFALLAAWLVLLSPPNHLNHKQKIQARGYLNWETRPSLITWFEAADGPVGFEYEILKRFAKRLGVSLRVIPADERTRLLRDLVENRTDLAGGNLTPTPLRQQLAHSSEAISWTAPAVVYNVRGKKVEQPEDLRGLTGAVLSHSSYEHAILPLVKQYGLDVTFLEGDSLSDVLEKVATGEFDYTVADTNLVKLYSHFIPGLRIGFTLSPNQPVVFLTGKQHDSSLIDALNDFLTQARKSGQLEKWLNGYLEKLERHTPADTVTFLKNYRQRWPKLRDKIRQTAKKHGLPWDLLGALAYQESHWNPKAVSPTGVKGLMMLTKQAARELGIHDRRNLNQSLDGGARYFKKMYNKIPERINEPDRTRLALAAYNIGYGHLEDARVLTQRNGGNPDSWQDVKRYLPELNNPAVANTLKHGRADGKTAVTYTENIITYRQLLRWKDGDMHQMPEKQAPPDAPPATTPVNITQPAKEVIE